jgi:hypothetical protein
MADALARLKERAREAAEKLGHRLGSFHATPGHASAYYANCEDLACGLGVVVDLEPRLPALAAAGDALVLACGRLEREAKERFTPPLPPRVMPSPPPGMEVLDLPLHEQRIRTSPAYARAQVYARDLGRCADCGTDTDALWKDLLDLSFRDLDGYTHLYRELRERGFPPHRLDALNLWDMNHKVPVCEGGGSCGLENLETLCLPCHARETAALMARLDERKRKAEQEMREWLARQLAGYGGM